MKKNNLHDIVIPKKLCETARNAKSKIIKILGKSKYITGLEIARRKKSVFF